MHACDCCWIAARTSVSAIFGDNAYALHFAAAVADLDTVKMLVEAGSDVVGHGDDHQVGVLGWATCFRRVREDVADYLLRNGAKLDLWSAIALDRADEVRSIRRRAIRPSWTHA